MFHDSAGEIEFQIESEERFKLVGYEGQRTGKFSVGGLHYVILDCFYLFGGVAGATRSLLGESQDLNNWITPQGLQQKPKIEKEE